MQKKNCNQLSCRPNCSFACKFCRPGHVGVSVKPAVFSWLEFHLQLGLFMARFSHLSAALTLHITLRFSPVCPLLIRLVRHARAAHSASFLPSCLSSERNCNALHSPFLFQLHCQSAHLFSLIEVRKSKFHFSFRVYFWLGLEPDRGKGEGRQYFKFK